MCIIKSSKGLQFLDLITYPEIQIKENSFTFITGESGCGKSTYLKLLNATVLPQIGCISYREEDISTLDIIAYRRKVLLVPQEVFLFDGSIQENFALYYAAREEQPPKKEQIQHLLDTCCVDFPVDTPCSLLSGGERQRAFLAVFLSFFPDVLLLDEATSALDEQTSRRLLNNIGHFCHANRITAVAVCHSTELAKHFSDDMIELKKGFHI